MYKKIYILLGLILVGLGILGLFLPILPTTPFMLAALALFSKSSPRLCSWLLKCSILQKFWENYHSKCGVPRGVKIKALIFLWLGLGISAYLKPEVWLWSILGVVGIGVSIHIIYGCRRKIKESV